MNTAQNGSPHKHKPAGYTIGHLANSLHPGRELKDWLCWPPDAFALLSIIMERTGCYRLCLIDYSWWRRSDWPDIVSVAAKHWLGKTTDILTGDVPDTCLFFTEHRSPPAAGATKDEAHEEKAAKALGEFREAVTTVEQAWDTVSLEELRVLNQDGQKGTAHHATTRALLKLLAMADTACAGMGLLEKTSDTLADSTKLTHCLANLMLTASGSLSTLPKCLGTVLPKMRTPQGGITTRSLSHHLTFHTTEIEVMWRTIPWSNHHQKTLNIIAVPFPFEVDEDNFEARSERFHKVQYFSYRSCASKKAEEAAKKYLGQIVELVWEQSQKLDQVHILVFPESSLSESLYKYLQDKFYERLISVRPKKGEEASRIYQLPLLVAGIHKGEQTPYGGEADLPTHNEVRMATFFAGRWYDIAQRKHHRWHLNQSQLVQYWLDGKLPSDRRWFEHISVAQRRLTILAPTGWLSLTSLICEDLAQQEPAASVIRGIGPTLLMALLSDGPQLNSRWPARYASVLADDPGTAVLSLTSLGMVKRSQKLTNGLHIDEVTKPTSHTVALWKDMIRGDQMINLTDDDKADNGKGIHNKAVRITISATYKEEFTLDGRSDNMNASVFQLEGFQQLELPTEIYVDESATVKISEKQPIWAGTNQQLLAGQSTEGGTWNDIRELTALQFALDSVIELRGKHHKQICSWFTASPADMPDYPVTIKLLLSTMAGAFEDPAMYGIDAEQQDRVLDGGTTEASLAAESIRALFTHPDLAQHADGTTSLIDYYTSLHNVAVAQFVDVLKKKLKRIHYLVPLATMYLIHAKVSDWNLRASDAPGDGDITKIILLRKSIRRFIMARQFDVYPTDKPPKEKSDTESTPVIA